MNILKSKKITKSLAKNGEQASFNKKSLRIRSEGLSLFCLNGESC
jgi:hypothetical protein